MLRTSSLIINAVIISIALLATVFLWGVNFFAPLDLFLYDQGLRYRVDNNPKPLNPAILKIDLNDSSENALAEKIDTRAAFADLLSMLGETGASAGLDFIFARSLPDDFKMVQAAGNFSALIYAVIPIPDGYGAFAAPIAPENLALLKKNLWHIQGNTEKFPLAVSFIMSNPEISSSATAFGHIGVEPDKDGVFRRVPVFYRWEDSETSGLIPSLSLAAAVFELGAEPADLVWKPGKGLIIPLGENEAPVIVPCDEQGYMLIPYGTRWETDLYRVSFADLLLADNQNNLLDEFFGVIAIIADITTSKRDYGVTPFETVYPLSGIHAAVLSGILDEYFYTESGFIYKIGLIATLLLLVLIINMIKKDSFFHCSCLLLLFSLCFLEFAMWNWGNKKPWFFIPAFFVFSSWVLNYSHRLFTRYREQLLYKNALSRYFPRALAERIAQEGKTELVPAYKELTILFSDISGFTKWSSDKSPEHVHNFLTDYLESMAEIIFSCGGTVDKFMGDGILAFFGDPFDMPDHCERCINAAIAMQKKVAALAEKWKPVVDIDLKVRIGINAGKVIVGNLGTKTRIEYTVIGAAVNLAQRMESNAPLGGILVTSEVKEKTGNKFIYGEKREITAKGYEKAVEAYEIIIN